MDILLLLKGIRSQTLLASPRVSWKDRNPGKTLISLYLRFTQYSGMYYDEDGDLAEEFYEEVTSAEGIPWMRRITENLTRQVRSF